MSEVKQINGLDRVRALIAAGARTTTAIKEVLGMTILDFAEEYGVSRVRMSEVVSLSRHPDDAEIDALVKKLGGSPDEWREFLWLAAKPDHVSAA